MKDLRMWFIFVFAVILIFWIVYEIIKPNLRNIWMCATFGAFTFILLFSDIVAQFMVKTPAFEAMAKLNNIEAATVRIDTVQTKIIKEQKTIKTDQKQLKELVEEMIKLVDIERKTPRPAIMGGPKVFKAIKEADEKIETEKQKLRSIIENNDSLNNK